MTFSRVLMLILGFPLNALETVDAEIFNIRAMSCMVTCDDFIQDRESNFKFMKFRSNNCMLKNMVLNVFYCELKLVILKYFISLGPGK